MNVYVVMGVTGEYSDRREWPVKAFLSQPRAEHLSDVATAEANRIQKERESVYGYYSAQVEEDPSLRNKHDPNMKMQYTGTDYYVLTVELDTEP